MAFTPDKLLDFFRSFASPEGYWVAYSGGMDSHALLHALVSLRPHLDAPVGAVHVDHGIHADARLWSEHCRELCDALDVPFVCLRVDARHGEGESPEASARDARYGALAEWLQPGDVLVSAHHQDDQAETLLLQLLRGSGPKGLGAMPETMALGRGQLLRPLLKVSRGDLRAYAADHGLVWVDDPSNREIRYSRNYLRHRILPELQQRWPAANAVIARSAALCAEAAELQDTVAVQDLAQVSGQSPGALTVPGLRNMAGVRVRNLLRYWLRLQGLPLPSQAVTERLVTEMLESRADAEPCVHWSGGEVRRYRDEIFAMVPLPDVEKTGAVAWDMRQSLRIAGGELVALEGLESTGPERLFLADADRAEVRVRFRQGGEQFCPAGRGRHHALKKLLQEWGVPPWERERFPLIFVGDELVAVPGLGVAEGRAAAPGQEGQVLSWSRWPAAWLPD